MIHSQNSRSAHRVLLFVLILGVVLGAVTITHGVPDKPTKAKMAKMIETARTPADHKAIADHYYAEAAQARAKAEEHEQMAAAYKKSGFGAVAKTPNAPGTIEHCNNLAKSYKAMAEDLTALAKEHERWRRRRNSNNRPDNSGKLCCLHPSQTLGGRGDIRGDGIVRLIRSPSGSFPQTAST